jgi:hypothetical protein
MTNEASGAASARSISPDLARTSTGRFDGWAEMELGGV